MKFICLRVTPLLMTALCGSMNDLAPQPPILVTSLCPALPCRIEQKIPAEGLDYPNVVWSFFLKILLPHSLTVSLCTNTYLRVCFRWCQIKETLKSKNSIRATPSMYENKAGTAVSGLSGSLNGSGQTSALP